MAEPNSYRTILRSTSVMGAASIINVMTGLVKMKVAAVLLGPAGVGLIGLFQNIMGLAGTVAGLGLATSGQRQIAAANGHGDADGVARARRALFWGAMVLAALGGALFMVLRHVIAERVAAMPEASGQIGWLTLGVVLSVAAGAQGALLTGLRRIGDLARVQVFSGLFSAIIGSAAILIWGQAGIVALVVSAPLASFVMGHWYVARLPRIDRPPTPLKELAAEWRALIALGVAFMVSGLVTAAGHLTARSLIQTGLGPEALGQFQAAWAISMTYLSFVLGAMVTDYFPRLSAVVNDHAAATRLVNEQTEVALMLTGPAILAMLGLAPWVVWLLYSAEFHMAADILRWQLLGDVLKVVSWPLGFVLVAAGRGKTFVFTEASAIGVFVVLTWLGLPLVGVTVSGYAFVLMYVWYLPLVYLLGRRLIGFRWQKAVLRQAGLIAGAALAVTLAAQVSDLLAAALGVGFALPLGLYAAGRLGQKAELTGRVGLISARARRIMVRLGIGHG